MTLYIYISVAVLLLIGIVIKLFVFRSFITKYKYIRLVQYNDDMTINIQYIKKDVFNQDRAILINSKHIYDFKGYKTVIITSNSAESINPIDFTSKFDPKDFKSAMHSKLISETFASLKVEKFDKMMFLIILNALTLLAVVYLLYSLMGGSA